MGPHEVYSHYVIERAHSLVITFEIFHICIYIYVEAVRQVCTI